MSITQLSHLEQCDAFGGRIILHVLQYREVKIEGILTLFLSFVLIIVFSSIFSSLFVDTKLFGLGLI